MSPKQSIAKDRRQGEKRMGPPRANSVARCGRPTEDGSPCGRRLEWYEAACHAHATADEQAAALQHLRSEAPNRGRNA